MPHPALTSHSRNEASATELLSELFVWAMRVTGCGAYTRPAAVPTMPPGLVELMEGLTKDVLRHNPPDLYRFCAQHMRTLLEIRDGPSKKKELTLKEKIAKAQKKVRERAEVRRQLYDANIKNQQSLKKDKVGTKHTLNDVDSQKITNSNNLEVAETKEDVKDMTAIKMLNVNVEDKVDTKMGSVEKLEIVDSVVSDVEQKIEIMENMEVTEDFIKEKRIAELYDGDEDQSLAKTANDNSAHNDKMSTDIDSKEKVESSHSEINEDCSVDRDTNTFQIKNKENITNKEDIAHTQEIKEKEICMDKVIGTDMQTVELGIVSSAEKSDVILPKNQINLEQTNNDDLTIIVATDAACESKVEESIIVATNAACESKVDGSISNDNNQDSVRDGCNFDLNVTGQASSHEDFNIRVGDTDILKEQMALTQEVIRPKNKPVEDVETSNNYHNSPSLSNQQDAEKVQSDVALENKKDQIIELSLEIDSDNTTSMDENVKKITKRDELFELKQNSEISKISLEKNSDNSPLTNQLIHEAMGGNYGSENIHDILLELPSENKRDALVQLPILPLENSSGENNTLIVDNHPQKIVNHFDDNQAKLQLSQIAASSEMANADKNDTHVESLEELNVSNDIVPITIKFEPKTNDNTPNEDPDCSSTVPLKTLAQATVSFLKQPLDENSVSDSKGNSTNEISDALSSVIPLKTLAQMAIVSQQNRDVDEPEANDALDNENNTKNSVNIPLKTLAQTTVNLFNPSPDEIFEDELRVFQNLTDNILNPKKQSDTKSQDEDDSLKMEMHENFKEYIVGVGNVKEIKVDGEFSSLDDHEMHNKIITDNQTDANTMDIENAAVTIQKVFRSFLFKRSGSTFDDISNDENNLEEDLEKKEDLNFSMPNPTLKERRPLGLNRMDTITVLQTVNEEKSLSLSDDSSTMSSAATTIQAHVKGFLVRNRLNSNKTMSASSFRNSISFASLDADVDPQQQKTILNIHIVPEGGHYLSRDESMLTSIDLPLDNSPPSSLNLHPLGYDKSQPRKQLKREDAIQSVSPPSNNSGKLSDEGDSIKEILVLSENGKSEDKGSEELFQISGEDNNESIPNDINKESDKKQDTQCNVEDLSNDKQNSLVIETSLKAEDNDGDKISEDKVQDQIEDINQKEDKENNDTERPLVNTLNNVDQTSSLTNDNGQQNENISENENKELQYEISNNSTINSVQNTTVIHNKFEDYHQNDNINENINENILAKNEGSKKENELVRMNTDEADVMSPYLSRKLNMKTEVDEVPKLLHSGEFHDMTLPTKVLRNDTSVRGE